MYLFGAFCRNMSPTRAAPQACLVRWSASYTLKIPTIQSSDASQGIILRWWLCSSIGQLGREFCCLLIPQRQRLHPVGSDRHLTDSLIFRPKSTRVVKTISYPGDFPVTSDAFVYRDVFVPRTDKTITTLRSPLVVSILWVPSWPSLSLSLTLSLSLSLSLSLFLLPDIVLCSRQLGPLRFHLPRRLRVPL